MTPNVDPGIHWHVSPAEELMGEVRVVLAAIGTAYGRRFHLFPGEHVSGPSVFGRSRTHVPRVSAVRLVNANSPTGNTWACASIAIMLAVHPSAGHHKRTRRLRASMLCKWSHKNGNRPSKKPVAALLIRCIRYRFFRPSVSSSSPRPPRNSCNLN